jgi:predicted SAM-dependent methyltransferase
MKLYVGANGLRPDGYKTVDIDPATGPDVVADICDMNAVETGACDEIVASHVLEHIEWPDAFKAIAEMVRCLRIGGVLKISVPDMSLYARMLVTGENNFHIMSVVYGLGGRTNRHQAHRFGYTPGMLCEIADILGCGDFDWFNIPGLQDSSGGWMPRSAGVNVAEALNFSCKKLGEAPVPPAALYEAMLENPLKDILGLAADLKKDLGTIRNEKASSALYQRIHYKLLETLQHSVRLERENEALRKQIGKA